MKMLFISLVLLIKASQASALPLMDCQIETVLNRHLMVSGCKDLGIYMDPNYGENFHLNTCIGTGVFVSGGSYGDKVTLKETKESITIKAKYYVSDSVFHLIRLNKSKSADGRNWGELSVYEYSDVTKNWKTYKAAKISCEIF